MKLPRPPAEPAPPIFAAGPNAPTPGAIGFYDGSFPSLEAGRYRIGVTQKVAGPETPGYRTEQEFEVEAPQFAIDPNLVRAVYPPPGGNGEYGEQVPFITLDDPSLPWERGIVPGGGTADVGNPLPWIALAIFGEGEILLQPETGSPLATVSVAELLAADLNVLKPQIPSSRLSPATRESRCQTITVPGEAFEKLLPSREDLAYLAHCRAIDRAGEGRLLISVAIANRLPVADGAPRRYFAHLVSLEGLGDYLGPNAKPLPNKPEPETGPCDVQLASLCNWSFVSHPGSGLSFEALLEGLIEGEQATPTLRLPPPPASLPPKAKARVEEGYAPLPFVSGAGEQTFAWYRGPLTPVVPQPLPEIGEPPVAADEATSADALTIYLKEEGIFDLSYAAGWNAGRQIGLADARFAAEMAGYWRKARGALGLLAQRLAAPHLEGAEAEGLLAGDASRRRFLDRVEGGLASRWTAAMAAARSGERPERTAAPRRQRPRRRPPPDPLGVLAQPWAGAALAEHLAEVTGPVAEWLSKLGRLGSVPFSHLVPDPGMLPPESVRFFYLDQGWIDALRAGATSIGLHSSADVALRRALYPSLAAKVAGGDDEAEAKQRSGLVIRSQLVAAWPALVVRASRKGVPLENLRDDCPSPSVRICLFDGVPDEVSIAEPYQGLNFGLVERTVEPRNVTARAAVGARIGGAERVTPPYREEDRDLGVLEVSELAQALAAASGASPFGSAAVVYWNKEPLQTTVVSPRLLEAKVTAASIKAAGTVAVTVVENGVTSAPAGFAIRSGGPAIEAGDPASAAAASGDGEAGASGPTIRSLEPGVARAGAADLPLSVLGDGFGANAEIRWNGAPLETVWHDAERLSATIPAESLSNAGTATVTVAEAGAESAQVGFPVIEPGPTIGTLVPAEAVAGDPGFTLRVVGGFGAGDLAIQLVEAPERQAFLPAPEAGSP